MRGGGTVHTKDATLSEAWSLSQSAGWYSDFPPLWHPDRIAYSLNIVNVLF